MNYSPSLIAATVALGVLVIVLGRRLRRAASDRQAARTGYFGPCLPLLSDVVERAEPHGFSRVSARFGDWPIDLQAIPDTLNFRKLPTLWLLVTIPAPMPVDATLSIMRRPSGTESFSQMDSLEVMLPPPVGFPPQTAVRTDNPAGLPSEDVIRAQSGLFADERAKELVISPKGLRIVWLAEEADRGRYLLFRDAELGHRPLARDVLFPLLTRLGALARTLHTPSGRKAG